MDAPTEKPSTGWGDAAGRRRDILASAEQLLSESGYAGLTVRAIAAGARVSSGTVYQYFSGKEDVFVALTAQRLERLRTTLAGVDRQIGVAGVLREILPEITELWRRLGRATAQWEAKALVGGKGSDAVVASATVFQQTLDALANALREAAEARGQTLIEDPALAHWAWDSLIGIADDLLLGGTWKGGVDPQHLIDFATAAIERSILDVP